MKKSFKISISVITSIVVVFAAVIVIIFAVVPSAKYNDALEFVKNGDYEQAITKFEEIGSFKDAEEQLNETKYLLAADYQEAEEYGKSAILYGSIKDYKDSREKSLAMWDKTGVRKTVSVVDSNTYSAAVKNDGTVVVSMDAPDWTKGAEEWKNIVSVSFDRGNLIGIKEDGSIVCVSSLTKRKQAINECGWTDVVKVDFTDDGEHMVAVKIDGTVDVLHYEHNETPFLCQEEKKKELTDIVDIIISENNYIALKSDGTVISDGTDDYGETLVADWTDIVAIAANYYHTVGLKKDGTVVATGMNADGECNVSEWTDIKHIAASHCSTIGIKEDGTAVSVGVKSSSMYSLSGYDVSEWTDVTDVFISYDRFAVGLREDGTVIFDSYASELLSLDIYDMKKWDNIRIPE